MAPDVSFSALVRQRAHEWPRVADLITSLLHAARQRAMPVDRSSLFALRNPEYRAREWDRLARQYAAWRTVFQSQDIIALRTGQENARRKRIELATGEMNMGKAYQRVAADRHIALLEEFIRLKAATADWPPAEVLVALDEEAAQG